MDRYIYNSELDAEAVRATRCLPVCDRVKETVPRVLELVLAPSSPGAVLPPEELVTHFSSTHGEDRQILPYEAVSVVPIPERAKTLLTKIGLPKQLLHFELNFGSRGLIRLDEYVQWWRKVEAVAFNPDYS